MNFSSKNQYTRNRRPSQEEKYIPPKLYLSEEETLEYCRVLKEKEPIKFLILDAIIYYWGRCDSIYFAQSTIARYVKVSREYVNRVMREFERLGIFKNFYRHKTTSLYIFPAKFSDREFNYQLGRIFKSLLLTIDFLRISYIPQKYAPDRYNPLQITQYIYNLKMNCSSKEESADFQSVSVSFFNPSLRQRYTTTNDNKKENMITPPSQVIMNLKCLALSKAGQVVLSAFPDKAILHAEQKTKSVKIKLSNPFGFFYNACRTWCIENNINPDYDKSDQVLKSLGLSREDEMLTSKNSDDISQNPPRENRGTPQPPYIALYKKTWNEYSRSCRLCAVKQEHSHTDEEIKKYYLAVYRKHFGDSMPKSLGQIMGGMFSSGIPELDPD